MALWLTMPEKTISGYSQFNRASHQNQLNGVGWLPSVGDPTLTVTEDYVYDTKAASDSGEGAYTEYLRGSPNLYPPIRVGYMGPFVVLGWDQSAFRIPELDRDFMAARGSALEGATFKVKATKFKTKSVGEYWGWDDEIPGGYVQQGVGTPINVPPVRTWCHATYDGGFVTSGDITIALVGIYEVNNAINHRILYTMSVGEAVNENTWVNLDAQDLIEVYLAQRANYMAFGFLALPPLSVDLENSESMEQDLAAINAATFPLGNLNFVDYGGSWFPFMTLTWDDYYWAGISVDLSENRYTGDFTLPSRARLVPQGTIPRQD